MPIGIIETPTVSALTHVISSATAPAFLLGAVAGFMSILISRLDRVIERKRHFDEQGLSEKGDPLKLIERVHLLYLGIYFAVLSALATATLLIVAFMLAFIEVAHEFGVAILFVLALVLLMASLIQFTREIRVGLQTIHLE